jgi:hypothetical protein
VLLLEVELLLSELLVELASELIMLLELLDDNDV